MLWSAAGIETHEITARKRDNAARANQLLPPKTRRQSGLSQTLLTGGEVQSSLPYKMNACLKIKAQSGDSK